MKSLSQLTFTIVLFCVSTTASSATLIWTTDVVNPDDLQLLGADNINVDGVLYDVRFVEVLCDSMENCDDRVLNSTFTDSLSAQQATSALWYQVFSWPNTDPTIPAADALPQLTFGINRYEIGHIITPYAVTPYFGTGGSVYVNGWMFENRDDWRGTVNDSMTHYDLNYDPFGLNTYNPSDPLSLTDFKVMAQWQLASAVPVPAAFWLMASGLLGLIGLAREKS